MDAESEDNSEAKALGEFISFKQAADLLRAKCDVSDEEIAMWAWLGTRDGGLTIFKNDGSNGLRTELKHPPDSSSASKKAPVAIWATGGYFLTAEVKKFDPTNAIRFISWPALVERWKAFSLSEEKVDEIVRSRIEYGELMDLHPIFGATELRNPPNRPSKFAPKQFAVFELKCIEAIEQRDLIGPPDEVAEPIAGPAWIPKSAVIGAFLMAYRDEGYWIRATSNNWPKAFEGCRTGGRRGGESARYNPLNLALRLLDAPFSVPSNKLDNAFETLRKMGFDEWEAAWQKYKTDQQ